MSKTKKERGIDKFLLNNVELKKIGENRKLKYSLTVKGEQESEWYGFEVKFLIEIKKNSKKSSIKNSIKLKCINKIYHPCISLTDGSCSVRVSGNEDFSSIFQFNRSNIKYTKVKPISFVDSVALLFYYDLDLLIKSPSCSNPFNYSLFYSCRLDNLILWSPSSHFYFSQKIREKIILMLNIFSNLKKIFLIEKKTSPFPPNDFQMLIKCPKGVFYLILGYLGRSSFIEK